MEKKSKAQIYLERVEMYDTIIKNKLIEQQQWQELSMSITANMGGEKVQITSSQSKMAEAVERCIDMEAEILTAVEKFIAEKRKATNLLEQMYSPIEYKILHMRYVLYISLADIAKKLNKEYTWVTTTHGRALKSFESLLKKEKGSR